MRKERKVTNNIHIEGAQLIFKNFQGKKGDYNKEGNRNFGVLLDEELAENLKRDGWNVKYLYPKDDDPEGLPQPWLPVKVSFNPYPPIVQLISSRGRIKLNEETVDQLDWTRSKNVDLVINPYNYPAMQGRPAGVSAYLKALYVTIEEDRFARKYADIPYLDEEDEEDGEYD